MIKFVFLLSLAFVLTSCAEKDENYYRLHPDALSKAVNQCPAVQPSHVSCNDLAQIAEKVNHMAYELQLNPLDFGRKIQKLQSKLARLELESREHPDKKNVTADVTKTKHELAQHLAIVKWLESPES